MSVQSQGRGESFRRRFLGAHFYNPPRYLYLLELIPTPDTDPAVLEAVRAFGDRVLGKGIVLANDVPGFIGNRIGIYSLLQTARVAEEMDLPADVVDALTGPVLGRPRSGTMRLADTVGLDVLALISKDCPPPPRTTSACPRPCSACWPKNGWAKRPAARSSSFLRERHQSSGRQRN